MFRLAMTLGMTVQELGDRMTSAEFSEWMAMWNIEPWGDSRRDLMDATVAAVTANAAGNKTKPSDFLPKFGERHVEKSPEDLRLAAIALTAMMTGKVPGV